MQTEMKIEICLTKEEIEVIQLLKSKYVSVQTYIRSCIKVQIVELKSELYSRKKIQELELEIAFLKSSNNNTNISC